MIRDDGLGVWFFARGFSVVCFISFVSLLVQIKGLIGAQGILPAQRYLDAAARVYGRKKGFFVPTLFWFNASDQSLIAVCVLGMAASVFAFAGWSQGPAFLVVFICYLSLESVGQDFLSFQWDALLIETSFLAIFIGPFKGEGSFFDVPAPSVFVVVLLWWLLFRLHFSSGVVKIASRDVTWRKLTALNHHYETQPLPNEVAWYVHQLPPKFQKFSVALMFFCELLAPFFIFAPQPLRLVAFFSLLGLQVLIQLTGNYGFFNILTMALCLSLLSDQQIKAILPSGWFNRFDLSRDFHWVSSPLFLTAGLIILFTSSLWLWSALRPRWEFRRWMSPLLRVLMPFKIANTYGLFAVMTRNRPEIIIEGSHDHQNWKPYEFSWKAGRLDKPPRWVAPHQPRLDWQMWFAALGDFHQTVWIQNLCLRLLQGEPTVLALLKDNPFPDRPPRYLRTQLYNYHFTNKEERRQTGAWWKREFLGAYGPEVSLHGD